MVLPFLLKEEIIEYIYKNPCCRTKDLQKNLNICHPTSFIYLNELIKSKNVIKQPRNKKEFYILLTPVIQNEMDWLFYIRERYKRTGKLTAPPKLR